MINTKLRRILTVVIVLGGGIVVYIYLKYVLEPWFITTMCEHLVKCD